MNDIFIKTKGDYTPLFFPANKLIILNKEQNIVITYSSGNANTLYQGEDAHNVYNDILTTRKEFWDLFNHKDNVNNTEHLKVLLDSFPYLTTRDITEAKDCEIKISDLYLPLLPNACSRVQVEEGKRLIEVIVQETDKTFIYVCNKESLKGLPCNNIDTYNKLLESVKFFYMINGLIQGITSTERIFYYPPIKNWYKYTPEIGTYWEGNTNAILQLTPQTSSQISSINIEELERMRQIMDKKLKEDFLRRVQALI